jgi:hypothetical protein
MRANVGRDYYWGDFYEIVSDADVLVRAAIDLFHQAFQNGRQLKRLTIIFL